MNTIWGSLAALAKDRQEWSKNICCPTKYGVMMMNSKACPGVEIYSQVQLKFWILKYGSLSRLRPTHQLSEFGGHY